MKNTTFQTEIKMDVENMTSKGDLTKLINSKNKTNHHNKESFKFHDLNKKKIVVEVK